MHAWQAIQNSLNYIEDHLSENIKMETLANVASLSPYYFQRLFGRLVKKSVNEYVRLRRLAKASEALKSKEKRIIDVALDYGFSDHANFTRAFKDAYGITPDAYRDCPVILNHFIKPDLLLNYIMVNEDVSLIADGIVVEVIRRKLDEPRTFIGIEGEVPDTELTGGKGTGIATTGIIWDEFHRQKSNILNLLPNGNEFGVFIWEMPEKVAVTTWPVLKPPEIYRKRDMLHIQFQAVNMPFAAWRQKTLQNLLVPQFSKRPHL